MGGQTVDRYSRVGGIKNNKLYNEVLIRSSTTYYYTFSFSIYSY